MFTETIKTETFYLKTTIFVIPEMFSHCVARFQEGQSRFNEIEFVLVSSFSFDLVLLPPAYEVPNTGGTPVSGPWHGPSPASGPMSWLKGTSASGPMSLTGVPQPLVPCPFQTWGTPVPWPAGIPQAWLKGILPPPPSKQAWGGILP